jgi:hypothetical protein
LILNTLNTHAKNKNNTYIVDIDFCYYATFFRLRRECHIRNLLEPFFNLDQCLSKSDGIRPVSDQFKVVTYLGVGPLLTVLGVLSNITLKLHSQIIRISLTCQSYLNLTRISSLLLCCYHLSRICFSLSYRSHRILISLSSRAHFTPIPFSSHFGHVTQVRWCTISSINRSNADVE